MKSCCWITALEFVQFRDQGSVQKRARSNELVGVKMHRQTTTNREAHTIRFVPYTHSTRNRTLLFKIQLRPVQLVAISIGVSLRAALAWLFRLVCFAELFGKRRMHPNWPLEISFSVSLWL